jgi:mRNA interferase MazF
MKRDCAINLDHLQTVSKGKIGALITKLSSTKIDELHQALNFALGFKE